jgi:hypothetical protein
VGLKLGLQHCKKESRIRVFENRVQRMIFGPKRDNRGMVKIAH